MGRRKITPEFYSALLDAFRERPGNAQGAADAVRRDARSGGTCTRRTAAKAWSLGWPPYDMKPIREVLELEQIAARATLEEARERAEQGIRDRAAERLRDPLILAA